MRWTRMWLLTSATEADDEIVWSWRPKGSALRWRQCAAHCADNGGNRQGSPRRSRISRKPLRREGRLSPPVPVESRVAQIILARAPRVHAATRPSLRPLFSRRATNDAKLGRNASRGCWCMSLFFSRPILRDGAVAPPQDEVVSRGALVDPHGEEARQRRLEP